MTIILDGTTGITTPAINSSGDLELPGGTANGVLYLNGSKIATSGSALVFDGTTFKADAAAVFNDSGADVDFRIESDTDANAFFLDGATGNVSIGFAEMSGSANYGVPNLGVGKESFSSLHVESHDNTNTANGSYFGLMRSRGSKASPTHCVSGDFIGDISGQAYQDAGSFPYRASANIRFVAEANHSSTSLPTNIQFFTTATSSITSTERARIDSSGNLLVGTTSTTPNPGVAIFPTGGMGQGNSAGGSGFEFNSFRRSAVQIGSITQNGTTAVAYNTSSDRRLKENITAAPEAGAKIDAIEIVSHDWKSAPDEHVEFGVVAQDLYAVAPQAVSVGDDGEEVEKTWGVDYSKLVPMLVKEIQSLRARVAALEAK